MVFSRAIRAYFASFHGLSRDIWSLSLVMLVNRSGAMVIPFMAVYLTQELGFSKGQAGIALSCFGVGSVIGSLSGGYLTDRFSYYWVQLWSLVLTGAGFLLISQVTHFLPYCIAVLLLAIVAESFRPANQVAILVYAEPSSLTRSLSLNRMAINLGFSIGPAVGGWLAYHIGFTWLFVVDAVTCWLAALLLWRLLRPKEEAHRSKGQTAAGISERGAAYRDRYYLIFLGFVVWMAVAFMQFFYVVPVYLREVFHWSESTIGTLLALNGLIIVLVEMPVIKRMEGRYRKLAIMQIGAVFIGVAYIVYEFFGVWYLIPWISIVLVTFGEIFSLPFANAVAQQRSSPGSRGAYMALYSASFSLAHIIAPSLGLQVAGHWGYPAVWWMLGVISISALLGFRVLINRLEPETRLT